MYGRGGRAALLCPGASKGSTVNRLEFSIGRLLGLESQATAAKAINQEEECVDDSDRDGLRVFECANGLSRMCWVLLVRLFLLNVLPVPCSTCEL